MGQLRAGRAIGTPLAAAMAMLFRTWTLGSLQITVLLLTAASAARAQDAATATAPAPSSQEPASTQLVGGPQDANHHASTAAAPHSAPAARRRDALRVSVRLAGGFGLGRPAIAGRVGLAGEYWLSDILGIGLSGAMLRQGAWLGDDSASESLALVGTLRGAANGGYTYFSFGAGYAHVKHTFHQGLCFGTECADRIERYHGIVIGAALGWLLHPSGTLELGPTLRFDLLVDPRGNTPADLAGTLGFELGFAQ